MRAAVILTHNRNELLRRCIDAVCAQVSHIVVIDNGSSPRVTRDVTGPCVRTLIYDPTQPPNLAQLMNDGLDVVARWAQEQSADAWDVAILCDDVAPAPNWFDSVRNCMRLHNCVAGSTHQAIPVTAPIVKLQPDRDIYNRMQGSAFIMAGETGLRADERMHWWWQDTDVDWQARLAGGMVIAPGPVVVNSQPNHFTNLRPELSERAGLDGLVFEQKWGFRPW